MSFASKLGLRAYALAALVIVLDQLSKYWILEVLQLPDRGPVQVLGPLHFSMVWNTGVSYGLLKAQGGWGVWALTLFAFAVALILAAWVRKTDRPIMSACLGLLIGGAIGNAIDRVRFGAVADFVDISRLHFPWVFNVADSAITIGIVLLLADTVRKDRTA